MVDKKIRFYIKKNNNNKYSKAKNYNIIKQRKKKTT